MGERLIFDIDPKTMDYLQCLYYEMLAHKSIMEDILLVKRKYEHNEKTCKYFMDQYTEAYTKFDLMKSELILEYAGIEYLNDNHTCEFDFLNRKLTIKRAGACSACH